MEKEKEEEEGRVRVALEKRAKGNFQADSHHPVRRKPRRRAKRPAGDNLRCTVTSVTVDRPGLPSRTGQGWMRTWAPWSLHLLCQSDVREKFCCQGDRDVGILPVFCWW